MAHPRAKLSVFGRQLLVARVAESGAAGCCDRAGRDRLRVDDGAATITDDPIPRSEALPRCRCSRG